MQGWSRTSHQFLPRYFKAPAAMVLVSGLILAVWLTVRSTPSSQSTLNKVSPETKKLSSYSSGSAEPAVNPAETPRRIAIDAEDRVIVSGDLRGALQVLQGAEQLKGPLGAEVKNKEVTVGESMGDEILGKLRQEEATLWQQATNEVEKSDFDAAKRDLRKILSYGDGGVRRADAQKYLDDVVPRRQKEEELFRQARGFS